ncbi:tetratricopeptide repeat protein [Microbulbifer salipaludis]|uniref:Tetratricopeptide repeat protein n=1 Tax=Microbulbifer salipaludis TaxID=187980 RepID=A0ABS3E3A0_9GAMM|nr:tetratricopeptide repeat protein [Microbulbifer salipaludis]MBN8429788.1 tetratricopeptide repeat protein [Microbulbifer salipaludis]
MRLTNRHFGNKRDTLLVVFALAAALLAGCAGTPTDPAAASDTPVTTDASGKRVPGPNPYLAEAGSVPAGAQQGINRARDYFVQQQYAAAETELQQVVTQWPGLSGAWLNLAKVQLKLNNLEAAEASLNQATTANANNVFAWNTLGVFLRDQGRFEEAQVAYESALAHWPDFAAAHRNLGILFDLYLHQPERALHHYREARALEPEEDRVLAGWIVDLERRL